MLAFTWWVFMFYTRYVNVYILTTTASFEYSGYVFYFELDNQSPQNGSKRTILGFCISKNNWYCENTHNQQ